LKLGKKSLQNLSTCCNELYQICNKAIDLGIVDFSVIEGHRGRERQTELFDGGKSRVQWPDGKHNLLPSDAADIVPYVNGAVSWNIKHCIFLAGLLTATAGILGFNLRWGGNWDMDGEVMTDQDFQDLVHYEIRR
jgi:peptidoglycan L-alanyl-D-glutamate endopeptidase CwlK